MYHTLIRIATSPISSVGTHQWADLVCNRGDEPMARGIHCCPNFLNFFFSTSVTILCRRCVYTVYTYLNA